VAFHEYRIPTRWRIDATVDEVARIFLDTERLPAWWPAAFLEVRTIDRGDGWGLGRSALLWTKGWLPYTLRLGFRVSECDYPRSFTLRVWGDFEGCCVVRVLRMEPDLVLEFDWRVRVRKPLVQCLSWLLKPLFAANHRWVMRRGRESLEIELTRRRTGFAGVPPGATFPYDRRTVGLLRRLAAPTRL